MIGGRRWARSALLAAGIAAVASPASAQREKPPLVRFKFQMISLDATIDEVRLRKRGEDPRLWIPNGGFSVTRQFAGREAFVLYREKTGNEGGTVRESVARLPVDPSMNGGFYRLLVLGGGQGKLRLVPIDFSGVRAQADTFFLVNLTESGIAIKLGPDEFGLEAGERRMLETSPDPKGRLPTLILGKSAEGFEPRYKDTLIVGNGNQGVILVFPHDEQDDLLNVRVILTQPLEAGEGEGAETERAALR